MKIRSGEMFINTDSQGNCWITETTLTKDGKPAEYRISGYCSTLEDALKSMYSKAVYKSEASSVEEAIKTISEAFNKGINLLEKAVREINPTEKPNI